MAEKYLKAAALGTFFIFIFLRQQIMSDITADFFPRLPASIDGWNKAAQPSVYAPGNLSDYIDGGAELYISYNFKSLLSVKYVKEHDRDMIIDIFDMGGSFDAFGVFAHSRETVDNQVGQGSEYSAGLLTFWKGRYYVSILAYPETPEKKKTIFSLGRRIADEINTEGPLPPVISLLPQENLVPESVRYFHHYIWLNGFYFVSNENILNIDDNTQAAMGKYRLPAGSAYLLLVVYPDDAKARAGHDHFLKQYLADSPEGILKMRDDRWAGCKQKGNLVAVVLNAPSAQVARAFLVKIKNPA
jgi:hypothetical protein